MTGANRHPIMLHVRLFLMISYFSKSPKGHVKQHGEEEKKGKVAVICSSDAPAAEPFPPDGSSEAWRPHRPSAPN